MDGSQSQHEDEVYILLGELNVYENVKKSRANAGQAKQSEDDDGRMEVGRFAFRFQERADCEESISSNSNKSFATKESKRRKIVNLSLPYVAGILDGEGCVGFSRTRKSIYPRVFIVNTYLPLLEKLKEQFGGDINPLSLRKENWKQGWAWRSSWSKSVKFLEDIYPYIFIKKNQIDCVIAWSHIRPGRGKKINKETMDFLINEMRWLNKKGINNEIEPLAMELDLIEANKI